MTRAYCEMAVPLRCGLVPCVAGPRRIVQRRRLVIVKAPRRQERSTADGVLERGVKRAGPGLFSACNGLLLVFRDQNKPSELSGSRNPRHSRRSHSVYLHLLFPLSNPLCSCNPISFPEPPHPADLAITVVTISPTVTHPSPYNPCTSFQAGPGKNARYIRSFTTRYEITHSNRETKHYPPRSRSDKIHLWRQTHISII